jgi:hypothetical protein
VPSARSVGKVDAARRKFAKVIGRELAFRCRVISFRFGDLIVAVDSHSLLAEFEFGREALIEDMASGDDPVTVRTITFRISEG